jgi:hypothetical protein
MSSHESSFPGGLILKLSLTCTDHAVTRVTRAELEALFSNVREANEFKIRLAGPPDLNTKEI